MPPVEDIESEDEDDDELLTKEVEQEATLEKKDFEGEEVLKEEVSTTKEKDNEQNLSDDPTEKQKEMAKGKGKPQKWTLPMQTYQGQKCHEH